MSPSSIIKDFFNNLLNDFKNEIQDSDAEKSIIEIENLGVIEEIESSDEIVQEEFANNIISIYDNFNNKYKNDIVYKHLEFYLVLAFYFKKEYNEALKKTNDMLDTFGEEQLFFDIKAEILNKLKNDYEAIKYYKKGYNLSTNTLEKLEIKKSINTLTEEYNKKFIDLPYDEIKYVFIDDEYNISDSRLIKILDYKNVPLNLHFVGALKMHELYILHPTVKGKYIPVAEYEEYLFRERFSEFSFFADCLGATKLTYKVIRGKDIDITRNHKQTINGSIGYNGYGSNFSIDKEKNSNTLETDLTQFKRTQIFEPKKAPFLSSELKWYKYEDSWQDIYKQRINGNLLKHTDYLSSKNTFSIDETEVSYLKADLNIISFNASFDFSEKISSTLKLTESIEWKLEVEFESLHNLIKFNNEEINLKTNRINFSAEQDYKEEIELIVEEGGIINDKERLVLKKLQMKLNISDDEALRIENEVLNLKNLTEDEKEYLEVFLEMKDDAGIKEKERKVLLRFANRLNISEERVMQLENSTR